MTSGVKHNVSAEAPSNIALIKYMGKTAAGKNVATNSSLSWTLSHLRTRVELKETSNKDSWFPLEANGWETLELGEKGRNRFLAHFEYLKSTLGIQGFFEVRSANNFPADCGLASSASSFAALTMAAAELAKSQGLKVPSNEELAKLSQKGSGSSCRSFFAPWSLWKQSGAREIQIPKFKDLVHAVSVVEGKKKEVSSSDAHVRVATSSLFPGRAERAEKRLGDLLTAFQADDWSKAFDLVWAEFWDMHALFETSEHPFGYMNSQTLKVLNLAREFWTTEFDGPLVTMDAGPNVHFLWRADQTRLHEKFQALCQGEIPYRVSL